MNNNKMVKVRFMKNGRNVKLANGTLLPKGISVIHQYFYDLPLSEVKEIARAFSCKYYFGW
jgi:hypothetical protein